MIIGKYCLYAIILFFVNYFIVKRLYLLVHTVSFDEIIEFLKLDDDDYYDEDDDW